MSKTLLAIILSVILVSIAYFFFFKKNTPLESKKFIIAEKPYNLEIAKTLNQQSIGLSKRSNLCQNCGMIFVFGKDKTLPFWMKDTLIPLDMIWVNSQGIIVSIETAQPEPNTPIFKLKMYQNSTPAQYVIELNAGDANKLNLKIGDKINLNL